MSRLHTACAVVAALFLAASMFGHTVALRLVLLAAGIVLASVVATSGKNVQALPPIWIPFALWGLWALVSIGWSLEPERTLKEWRNEVFYTAAALWICFVAAQARPAMRIFLCTLAAAAAIACLVALYEYGRGWESYLVGWHGGPGDHSSALLTLTPCALATAWYARQKQAHLVFVAAAVLILLILASAYATQNRTIWIGLAVQSIGMGAIALRVKAAHTQGSVPGTTKWAAGFAALTIAAAAAAMLAHIHVQREAQVQGGGVRDSRLEVWSQVAERALQRPVLGHGFGRGIQAEAIRADLGGSANLWHAHNLLLDTMLQTGIIGLLLLVGLLAASLRVAWRGSLAADAVATACAVALFGVIAGMLVRNMTDTLLVRQNALLFWGAVGVLLGSRTWRA